MSASSVITSMQSALNCASKCDCCSSLQSQIDAINAALARLKKPEGGDINALIGAAVGAAISQRLPGAVDSSVNARVSGLNLNQYATRRFVDDYARGLDYNLSRKADNSALDEAVARIRDGWATKEELRAVRGTADHAAGVADSAVGAAGTATKVSNSAYDKAEAISRRNALLEKQANEAFARLNNIESTANSALSTAGTAIKDAANVGNEVSGLRGIVNGFGAKFNEFGLAIARAEKTAGDAIAAAARAIGISGEALAATGRLAGRLLEAFNAIGILFTLIEQLATLKLLGGRIDAIEAGLEALGASVSGILGKLLGLQNRIGRNEAAIGEVRAIAVDAKGIGETANLRAGTALIEVKAAQGTADTALADAKQAQLTADGAVRNAATANENATTAYKKATEATAIANTATAKANEATTVANTATNRAGEAFSKAVQALGVALTAISLYQGLKGLKGLKGDKGDRGFPGIKGDKGDPGITTVITLPGTKGDKGDKGDKGRNGINGINGINGKDGKDVNPADIAGLKAFIAAQHQGTQGAVKTHTTALHAQLTGYLASQFAGVATFLVNLTTYTKNLINWAVIDRLLNLMTTAATIHNALMLSNNLGTTLGGIIDSIFGLFGITNANGSSFSFTDLVGRSVTAFLEGIIGEANYKNLSENWAKANRIYQATANVFNSLANFSNTIISGLEIIGGTVGKIGNALRKWGVVGETAFQFFNPQPNFHNKIFVFLENANNEANTIQNVVNVPVSIKQAATDINTQTDDLMKTIGQDKSGKPSVTPPEASLVKAKDEVAKEASKGLNLSDFYSAASLQWLGSDDGGAD